MPVATKPAYPSPLKLSPALLSLLPEDSQPIDITPAIGTEFPPSFQLSSILPSTSGDASEKNAQLVRDLATLVSQRGVVFFRKQDLTPAQQKVLVDMMGRETGRPKESGLHIHPLQEGGSELGGEEKEVFKIT
jgi:hypothetical protein